MSDRQFYSVSASSDCIVDVARYGMIDSTIIEGMLKMKLAFVIGVFTLLPMGYSICAPKPNIVFVFTDDQGYSDV